MSVLNKRQEQSLCLINAAMIYQAYKLKKNPCFIDYKKKYATFVAQKQS